MPAPKGNKLATTHGLYGFLSIGSLPKGASYIRRQLGRFERFLTDAVREKYGQINIFRAALIQSAVRHEGRAQLLTRWLRHAESDLKLTDKLAVLREIGSASDQRDRVIRQLQLADEAQGTLQDLLYRPLADETVTDSASRSTSPAPDAPAAQSA